MSITVENGSIVSGANSYVTEAELTAYVDARDGLLNGLESALILKAMDYLESLNFIGSKTIKTQPLQWPRNNVFIDGFEYENNEIPSELKNAQLAIATAIDEGIDPLGAISRAVKREKVDVIEVEYMDNSAPNDISRSITSAIRKLVLNSSGGVNFRVIRG